MDFPFQTDKVMNSGEPAVNCPGCNQATKKTDKAGHGRTMPRFNLITTRPISKKTSPHSVPPSADNSLYRIPFFFETPTKENTKDFLKAVPKVHLTFGQIKTISHIEKDSLWIDGFGNWNVAWLRTRWHHGANTSDSPGKSIDKKNTEWKKNTGGFLGVRKKTGNCSTYDTATTPFLPTFAWRVLCFL